MSERMYLIMNIGLKGHAETVVDKTNTAATIGSGNLEVFATPHMIALMECASLSSVAPELEEGMSTVGTHLDVSHDAATPLGMKVWADSELVEIDGRRLVFDVKAYDECGLIGQGKHERFIVKSEKFLAKVNAKANK
jgi:fluoroacetyl-CoA thioesterase